jgi:hypothetical protein
VRIRVVVACSEEEEEEVEEEFGVFRVGFLRAGGGVS